MSKAETLTSYYSNTTRLSLSVHVVQGGSTDNPGTATNQPSTSITDITTGQSVTTTATTTGIGDTSGQAASYGRYHLIMSTVALTVIKLLLY